MTTRVETLALFVESAVRGASGGTRQSVAAATAAAVRVAAEVFLGIDEPDEGDLETKERLGNIKAIILKRVEVGTEGCPRKPHGCSSKGS